MDQLNIFDMCTEEAQQGFAPDARNEEGTLLCICGTPQQFYSGLLERGICSEECYSKAVAMWKGNQNE